MMKNMDIDGPINGWWSGIVGKSKMRTIIGSDLNLFLVDSENSVVQTRI